MLKDHLRVRTGDHDNKVADDFEQEFEVEELISHRLYDGKRWLYLLYIAISMFGKISADDILEYFSYFPRK